MASRARLGGGRSSRVRRASTRARRRRARGSQPGTWRSTASRISAASPSTSTATSRADTVPRPRALCGPSHDAEGVPGCHDTPAGHAPPWGPPGPPWGLGRTWTHLDAGKGRIYRIPGRGVQIYSLGSKVRIYRKSKCVQVVSKWCPSHKPGIPLHFSPGVQIVQRFQETPTKSGRPRRGGVYAGKARIVRTPPGDSDPMGMSQENTWTLGHFADSAGRTPTTRAQHHLDTSDSLGHPPRRVRSC